MTAVVAAVAVGVLTAEPAAAFGPYLLKNRASGLCLDAAGWSKERGAAVIQWDCHGGANQRWYEVGTSRGRAYKNEHSGLCIDLAGWSREPGAKMIQYDCHLGDNQLFNYGRKIFVDGSYSWEMVNRFSGQCLDVPRGSSQPGVQVQQWWCNGHWAQQWQWR